MIAGILNGRGFATWEIAALFGCDKSTAWRLVERHEKLLAECAKYREKAGRVEI